MGYNILGIATSQKPDNIQNLASVLGIKVIEDDGMFDAEEATSNSIDGDSLYLIPTTKGSLVMIGDGLAVMDTPLNQLSINGKVLKFMIGETSSVYCFEYYENGKLLRSVISMEEEDVLQQEGKALHEEFLGITDFTELVFLLMQKVCGDRPDTLNPEAAARRYQAVMLQEVANADSKPQKKSWWKFW